MARHEPPTLAGSTPVPVADYAPCLLRDLVHHHGGVRDVHGTFQVPLFLQDTTQYSGMTTDAAGNPVINGNGTWTANFICVLPSTVQPGGPATPTVYGHGLLGSASEVEGGSFSAGVADNLMGCATDWVGMSESDVGNVVRNLNDMSTFSTQVDHMLQGFVNFQFLGRLINSPDGFVTDPAFQDGGGNPLFKTNDCHFMGYSQGGIMGGAVSAVSTEWTRVILGVPGMDYGGLLLQRSVDWDQFAAIFDQAYTNPVDQQLVLQLAQLLWDRGENEGYAEQLVSDPYPGIPAKQVFIIENYGDHQVANVSAEMLARTLGARNHQPAFNASFLGAPDRLDIPVTPQWGIPPARSDESGPGRTRAVGLRHADAADREPGPRRTGLRRRPPRLRSGQRRPARPDHDVPVHGGDSERVRELGVPVEHAVTASTVAGGARTSWRRRRPSTKADGSRAVGLGPLRTGASGAVHLVSSTR